jgi:hypothetical protein
VRRLVFVLACAALLVPSAVVASGLSAPALRTMSSQPLAVRGVHFRAAERVTVRVAAGESVRVHVVRATAAGTFTTTFTAVVLERCSPFVVTARGSKGSVATIRSSVFRDCAPLY